MAIKPEIHQPKKSPGLWDSLYVIAAIVISVIAVMVILGIVDESKQRCLDVSEENCTRVLFIGNSFTSVNDLPSMFARLANSGGHRTEAKMATGNGWTLAQHTNSPSTIQKMKSERWDYIVLQEQSLVPATQHSRANSMYPASDSLIESIRNVPSSPLYFQTWAYRNGWPGGGIPDFEGMQAAVDTGYQEMSANFNVPIAPVGDSWFNSWKRSPQIQLWQEDGMHPTVNGTYLAACVFYATIFNESPVGLDYTADIPVDEARMIQSTAALVVLGSH